MINTPVSVKFKEQTQVNRSRESQRIAPRLRETKQMSDKQLTTLFIVKLGAQQWSFSAGETKKIHPGPLRAGIADFT